MAIFYSKMLGRVSYLRKMGTQHHENKVPLSEGTVPPFRKSSTISGNIFNCLP